MGVTAPPQAEPSATASDNQTGIPDLDMTQNRARIVLVDTTAISITYGPMAVPR
jgi:hypothetical protein